MLRRTCGPLATRLLTALGLGHGLIAPAGLAKAQCARPVKASDFQAV